MMAKGYISISFVHCDVIANMVLQVGMTVS